jgi:hypothetical protein
VTTTIAVAKQPSLTKAVTLKCLVPSTFKVQATVKDEIKGTIKSTFIYNDGDLSHDLILEVSSVSNKDGTTHNLMTLRSDRIVTVDDIVVETQPIKVGVYWDVPGTYEDPASVVDLLGTHLALLGRITADGVLATTTVAAVALGITASALG